ncbi:glycosyltransferase family 4 protein [Cellvibrio sp.]|uniref:glycosyltransferase family 4 protein n=1 Tax=Cellvibrio sp. TaxID=1965322 RepID=UPI0039648B9A
MGHDVIEDRYARLYEQPFQLAELGHDVLGVCLSYRNCTTKDELHSTTKGSMRWIGLSAGKLRLNLVTYPFSLLNIAREFKPDIIVGASDCLHVALGYQIARTLKIKFAADLYDNFESFGLAQIPSLKYFYRRALINAQAVSCVSEPLAKLVKKTYLARGDVFALHSTIDKSIFFGRDKQECRKKLGLPRNAQLIGTAGGLSRDKGIEPVYAAFLELKERNPNLHLVIAGAIDQNCPPPNNPHVHYLGALPHREVATLFGALDVAIVYLRNTPYGIYSFPQKIYEICACQVPVVVANVGSMSKLFENSADILYNPDNAAHLACAIENQLTAPSYSKLAIMDWKDQAHILENVYEKILSDG